MVTIGIIGKGYIGENIKFFNQFQKKKIKIIFFSTSKYFLGKNDILSRLNILKKKKSKIREDFLNFILNCDLIINTFTIQYEEFSKLDYNNRKRLFNFFDLYAKILMDEIEKKKITSIHLSTNKNIENYSKKDANYWYTKCHKLFQNRNFKVNIITIPNIFGYIKKIKKGKNLLINNIIDKSLKGKKFKFVNKNKFYRDILLIDDLCKIFFLDGFIKIDKKKKIKYEIKKAQQLINQYTFKIEVHEFSEIVFNYLNISTVSEFKDYEKKLSNNYYNKKLISILQDIRYKKIVL